MKRIIEAAPIALASWPADAANGKKGTPLRRVVHLRNQDLLDQPAAHCSADYEVHATGRHVEGYLAIAQPTTTWCRRRSPVRRAASCWPAPSRRCAREANNNDKRK